MKRAGGRSVQGYNAQVVAGPEQVIIAAQVTQSHNDADQLPPTFGAENRKPPLRRLCATASCPGLCVQANVLVVDRGRGCGAVHGAFESQGVLAAMIRSCGRPVEPCWSGK
jgi:hypothetical protein